MQLLVLAHKVFALLSTTSTSHAYSKAAKALLQEQKSTSRREPATAAAKAGVTVELLQVVRYQLLCLRWVSVLSLAELLKHPAVAAQLCRCRSCYCSASAASAAGNPKGSKCMPLLLLFCCREI
jgi:hypothetical protein